MKCCACETQLPHDAKFCNVCGEKLKFDCPECNKPNPPGSRFCLACGGRLAAEGPPQIRMVADAERKHVTALFSDITGYTSITERLDPEKVKQITGDIFAGIREIVARYDGFIEGVMGDGVVAFFGVPQVHEDDAIRAVHTAMEIHDLVEGLGPAYQGWVGSPLSMHTGINTGLVVTADVDIDRGTHGIAGDAVNVAARLSGLAAPGEILVGVDTLRRTRERFNVHDLGLRQVKGKADPIPVFKIVSCKPLTHATGDDRRISSEMVGRDRELDRLEFQVTKALNGEGSIVNVMGEAGIGKSRLIAELKKRDVMKRVTLLEGRAISIGKNLSFHLLIDILKQWAGISEIDSQASAFEKLEKAIGSIHPNEAYEILPFVATLMGMNLTGRHAERVKGIEGEALDKLIFKNVRELVIKGAELRPTIVVLEDFHWADASSIEMLEALYRLVEKHRVVFITVFRPGYFQTDQGNIARTGQTLPGSLVAIEIRPLDNTDAESLVDNMLAIKGLPYKVKHQIVERAGGNPFFIEELLRSLIDEGAVVRRGGGFEVTDKIEKVLIPPTINDVLMARIDRLEERTRELVKVASVIGRSFFDRILRDVSHSIEDIAAKLQYLKDIQLIRERIRMEELEYLFKHALAQEAAYESTLIHQRKAIHLKVAQSIERVFQARLHEFYGMLAYHYSKGDDPEKAEEYMVKAGEEALRTSASREALHYYQEGLKLYLGRYGAAADAEKIAKFEKSIAVAFYNKAQLAHAAEYLEKVLERWQAPLPKTNLLGKVRLVRDLLVVLKKLYLPSRKLKPVSSERENEIFDLLYRSVVAFIYVDQHRAFFTVMSALRRTTRYDIARIPDGPEMWAGAAGIFSYSGMAFTLADRCLEYSARARTSGHDHSRTQYACLKGINQHCRGFWNEMEKVDEDLIAHGLRYGDLWHTSTYMWAVGLVKAEQGEFCPDLIERILQIGTDFDYEIATEQVQLLRADQLVRARFLPEAVAVSDEGIASSRQDTNFHQIMFWGLKGEAQLLLQDQAGAKETITAARAFHEKQKMVTPLFAAPYLAARFLSDIGELQQSISAKTSPDDPNIRRNAFRSGMAAVNNARKYAPYRTKIFRLMGLYYWLIGKQGKALRWWDRTIEEGERLGARPDLSRTYFEVGKRLLEPRSKHKQLNGIDANGYLEKADILFRQMGLQPDLEELERVRLQM